MPGRPRRGGRGDPSQRPATPSPSPSRPGAFDEYGEYDPNVQTISRWENEIRGKGNGNGKHKGKHKGKANGYGKGKANGYGKGKGNGKLADARAKKLWHRGIDDTVLEQIKAAQQRRCPTPPPPPRAAAAERRSPTPKNDRRQRDVPPPHPTWQRVAPCHEGLVVKCLESELGELEQNTPSDLAWEVGDEKGSYVCVKRTASQPAPPPCSPFALLEEDADEEEESEEESEEDARRQTLRRRRRQTLMAVKSEEEADTEHHEEAGYDEEEEEDVDIEKDEPLEEVEVEEEVENDEPLEDVDVEEEVEKEKPLEEAEVEEKVEEDRDGVERIGDAVAEDAGLLVVRDVLDAARREYDNHQATKERYRQKLWARSPTPNGGCLLDQLQGIWFALAAVVEIQREIRANAADLEGDVAALASESMHLTSASMTDIKARVVHVVHVHAPGLLVKRRGKHRAFGNT